MPAVRTLQSLPNALARVDAELCIACGQCEEVCPTGAIKLEKTAVVDETQCIGCRTCVEECPVEAISLVERPAKQGDVR